MDMKVLEMDEKSIRLVLKGEDHTFLGLLQHYLLEDEDVCVAKYKVSHPLVGDPELFVKIKEGEPIEAIKRANEKIINVCNTILSQIP